MVKDCMEQDHGFVIVFQKQIIGNNENEISKKGCYVEIIDFTNAEVIQLVDLMRNEFPGFVDITRVQSSGPRYRMLYHTSADLQKLGTWVDISLEEIGLKIDTDVQRIITEQRIDIRRIDPATRKGSTGNTLKYN